mmetsp:Transcript_10438/g.12264  ORF Transcript_10438/g.12264 Transcript_10438/m.12264 type:complete len:617 (-) Transcript_10438:57-1907(-)
MSTAKILSAIPRAFQGGGSIRRCCAPPRSTSTSTSSLSSSTTTTTTRTRVHELSTKSRLGIGGSRLAQTSKHGDGQYASIIATSLQNGVRTFECGHGGEEELRRAYTDAIMYLKTKQQEDETKVETTTNENDGITMTARFGYRTALDADSGDGDGGNTASEGLSFPNDIIIEDDATSILHIPTMPPATTTEDDDDATVQTVSTEAEAPKKNVAYHNLSRQYVSHALASSPLVELQTTHPNVHLIYMAHNPETQGVQMALQGAPIEDVREFVKDRMTDAFVGLEMGVAEGQIGSYGVCSNGLSLPNSHPLHLGWEDLLTAASHAVQEVHGRQENDGRVASLSTLQLPVNLLETYGLTVVENVKRYLASNSSNEDKIPCLPNSINAFFTRPLTCYPDRGTGTGKPFKLLDYQIPTSLETTDNPETQWTHQIPGPTPTYYTPTLNTTMSHFDATHILEAQHIDERKLTSEERDTLDGCKLLQSMIHDLDSNLSSGKLRSFAAYEEELYTNVVPLIHDSFEELDGGTAEVLARFFKAYGESVRCSIAKTTRELLRTGGEGGQKYEIGEVESLQEFALKELWRKRVDLGEGEVLLADRVIVGCPKAEYVIQAMKAADSLDR